MVNKNNSDWKIIIIWILFVLSLIIAFWYIFGNSPTFEQAILVFGLTVLFTLTVKVVQIGTELKSLTKSFINLVNDLKEGKLKK
ncbi:hypothetical protein J4233_05005 [Candidatus Pacearchaeota archaeon]|nr:hypothetical protein [Candidatus Pacearchaeota archaeon]